MNHIAPLWICPDSVDIGFGGGTEANDNDVFKVMAVLTGTKQKSFNQITLTDGGNHTDHVKKDDQTPWDMSYLHKKDIDEQE